MKLIAKFQVDLDAALHVASRLTVSRPGNMAEAIAEEGDELFDVFGPITFSTGIDDFQVTIVLMHELVENMRLRRHQAPAVRSFQVDLRGNRLNCHPPTLFS